jgi:hypothetical protein
MVEIRLGVGETGGAEERGVAGGIGVAVPKTPKEGRFGGPRPNEGERTERGAGGVRVGAGLVIGWEATTEKGLRGDDQGLGAAPGDTRLADERGFGGRKVFGARSRTELATGEFDAAVEKGGEPVLGNGGGGDGDALTNDRANQTLEQCAVGPWAETGETGAGGGNDLVGRVRGDVGNTECGMCPVRVESGGGGTGDCQETGLFARLSDETFDDAVAFPADPNEGAVDPVDVGPAPTSPGDRTAGSGEREGRINGEEATGFLVGCWEHELAVETADEVEPNPADGCRETRAGVVCVVPCAKEGGGARGARRGGGNRFLYVVDQIVVGETGAAFDESENGTLPTGSGGDGGEAQAIESGFGTSGRRDGESDVVADAKEVKSRTRGSSDDDIGGGETAEGGGNGASREGGEIAGNGDDSSERASEVIIDGPEQAAGLVGGVGGRADEIDARGNQGSDRVGVGRARRNDRDRGAVDTDE